MKRLRSLRKDQRGVIAIEAALVSIPLLTIVVGAVDFGIWSMQATAVQNGLGAAGQYNMTHTATSGVQAVVQRASGFLTSASVAVTVRGQDVTVAVSVPFIGASLIPMPTAISASGTFTLKPTT